MYTMSYYCLQKWLTPVKTLDEGGACGIPLLSPSTPPLLLTFSFWPWPISPPPPPSLANSSAILFNMFFTSLDLDRARRVLDSLSNTKFEQFEEALAAEDRLLQLDQELAVEEEEQLDRAESIILELHLDLWSFLHLQQQQQVWCPLPPLCEFLAAVAVSAGSWLVGESKTVDGEIGGKSFTVQSCWSLLLLPA